MVFQDRNTTAEHISQNTHGLRRRTGRFLYFFNKSCKTGSLNSIYKKISRSFFSMCAFQIFSLSESLKSVNRVKRRNITFGIIIKP